VAVVGPGEPGPAELEHARVAGAKLAEGGAVVVCGGRGGVMEAACRGAKEAGGTTLGILPGSSRAEANPYVDVAIPTGMGEMRNALVVRTADALVAIGGKWGTLSEVAFALQAGKPVFAVQSFAFPEITVCRSGAEAAERALAAIA
jgi:uncharacterized protein (TIGR00725 family)